MKGAKLLALAIVAWTLASCDKPNEPEAAREWARTVSWREQDRQFLFDGRPASMVRVWDFEKAGEAEGFTAFNAKMTPVKGLGLVLVNSTDPGLRSPDDLKIKGREGALLLVRLTRRQPTPIWDGSVFHQTRWHGESEKFANRLPEGPETGAATVVVYAMTSSPKGGRDWATSEIKRLRIDLEADGGETVVHQIALVREPL